MLFVYCPESGVRCGARSAFVCQRHEGTTRNGVVLRPSGYDGSSAGDGTEKERDEGVAGPGDLGVPAGRDVAHGARRRRRRRSLPPLLAHSRRHRRPKGGRCPISTWHRVQGERSVYTK